MENLTKEQANKLNKLQTDLWWADLPMELRDAVIDIVSEYHRAKEKFPQFPTDVVHAAAIVAEESGELIRAALQYSHEKKGGVADIKTEAIQTAAMGFRFLLNLKSNGQMIKENLLREIVNDILIHNGGKSIFPQEQETISDIIDTCINQHMNTMAIAGEICRRLHLPNTYKTGIANILNGYPLAYILNPTT